ncbi:putative ankyrin repeat region domain-containing protein [Phytophthora infestans]|uniref:Putative ankyrin repeat region domain-containing protein n=1 Tax=Phytophthora infestans TaxID=4787 RepID=A0A833WJ59_PHYIN|nr:putative ankyrin repeat region domain-containing protein [Phytophthora infestans]
MVNALFAICGPPHIIYFDRCRLPTCAPPVRLSGQVGVPSPPAYRAPRLRLLRRFSGHFTALCRQNSVREASGAYLDQLRKRGTGPRLLMDNQEEKIITFVPIAAQNGYLVIVRWVVELTQQKHTTSERVVVAVAMLAIHAAAFHGHLEVAKYLREIARCGECTLGCREASSRQQTRGLHNRWLLSGGQMATSILNRRAAMDGAPLSGCLELVQWLHQYRTEGCTSKAMDNAAMNGRGEMASFESI